MGEARPVALTGWGRTGATTADLELPDSTAAVAARLAAGGRRGVVARGLGRSYGDAAQNGGGLVESMNALQGIVALDASAGRVRVQGGISLDRLMRTVVPLGWFVAVSPGTRYVTVGGAIAADIHGKNHHRDGSFARYVDEIQLLAPSGSVTAGPEREADVFWSTTGGMGLTGVITEATMRLLPIETSAMRVDTDRVSDLDGVMAMMTEGDSRYRYSVAWIDCLSRGASLGRGVLMRGDHATLEEVDAVRRRDPLRFSPLTRLSAPPGMPGGLVNRLSIRAFNEVWFRKAPLRERGRLDSIGAFFHPLDAVANWNRVYGPGGFLQYQVAVPFGAEEVIRDAIERFSGSSTPSFLAVLKRFGAASPGPLSFPAPGWTLALDMPAGLHGLAGLLDDLDERVAAAGGRVYLAKDSRMRAEVVRAMYPRLDEWRQVQRRLDPRGVMQSDLSRRLRLTATHS
jgi:decaprenylphospho-beta-D-ribofuranose 2-oxidase